jgi:hypothetical protein
MFKIPELAEKLVHKLFPILDAIIQGSDTPSRIHIRRSGSDPRTISSRPKSARLTELTSYS